MATFRLFAKANIGTGTNKITKGSFIQICKDSTNKPSTFEIKEAIKNQLGITVNTTPDMGNFDWEMIK